MIDVNAIPAQYSLLLSQAFSSLLHFLYPTIAVVNFIVGNCILLCQMSQIVTSTVKKVLLYFT